jgi:hypothetical protein
MIAFMYFIDFVNMLWQMGLIFFYYCCVVGVAPAQDPHTQPPDVG